MSLANTAYFANGFAVGGMMVATFTRYKKCTCGNGTRTDFEQGCPVHDPRMKTETKDELADQLRRRNAELENKLSKTISEINKDEDDRIKAWETVDELRRRNAELEAEVERLEKYIDALHKQG